jgi:hypothetical protein
VRAARRAAAPPPRCAPHATHVASEGLTTRALPRSRPSRAAALAPLAFPRRPAPRREFASAFDELKALWPDTWRLLRREFLVWLTWASALAPAAYTLLRLAYALSYEAHRGGGVSLPPALWASAACGAAACGATLALVRACAAAAARRRREALSPRAAAAAYADADPERGTLTTPLLSECGADASGDDNDDGAPLSDVDDVSSAGATRAARASTRASTPAADAPEAPAAARKSASLWRLIALSAPDKYKAIGAFIFLVLAVVCDVAIPNYKSDALNAILQHHAAALLRGHAGGAGGSAPGNDFSRAVLALAVASAGAGLFGGLRGGLLSLCNYRLVRRLQAALYGRLIRRDIASLDALSTGKLLSRLTTDTGMVGDVLGLNVNVAFRSLLRLLLTVGYLGTLSLPLTGVALGSSLAFFVVTFFFSRYQRVSSKAAQEATADSNHVAEQVRVWGALRKHARMRAIPLRLLTRAVPPVAVPGAHRARLQRRSVGGVPLQRRAGLAPVRAGAPSAGLHALHHRLRRAGQRAVRRAARRRRAAVRVGRRGRRGAEQVHFLQRRHFGVHPVHRGHGRRLVQSAGRE